jgi:hypothetical protein
MALVAGDPWVEPGCSSIGNPSWRGLLVWAKFVEMYPVIERE